MHKRVFFYRSKVQESINRLQSRLSQVNEPFLRNEIVNNLRVYEGLYKSLTRMEAALEVLIIKLETLGLLNVSTKDLSVVKEVLSKLRNEVSNIPDVSMVIDDLIDRANDLLEFETGVREGAPGVTEVGEASKVLSEAEIIAKERLRELTP